MQNTMSLICINHCKINDIMGGPQSVGVKFRLGPSMAYEGQREVMVEPERGGPCLFRSPKADGRSGVSDRQDRQLGLHMRMVEAAILASR